MPSAPSGDVSRCNQNAVVVGFRRVVGKGDSSKLCFTQIRSHEDGKARHHVRDHLVPRSVI
jgi:hypothetical protein